MSKALMFIAFQPSKELAEQTFKEINNFKKHLEAPVLRTMLATGGVPIKEQLQDLQRGVSFMHSRINYQA